MACMNPGSFRTDNNEIHSGFDKSGLSQKILMSGCGDQEYPCTCKLSSLVGCYLLLLLGNLGR